MLGFVRMCIVSAVVGGQNAIMVPVTMYKAHQINRSGRSNTWIQILDFPKAFFDNYFFNTQSK